MNLPCPYCKGPLAVTPNRFTDDRDELLETCPRCGGEVIIRRRPRGYEYAAEKPAD